MRGFYLRRCRRLLPASTVVVIATVVVGRIMQRPPIVRPAVAALSYWSNFERYTSHYSYGKTSYAPLEHYWSLAVEEQFYLVLPVLCLLLLPLGRRLFASVTAALLVASAVFAFAHRHDPQMYFHTGARACELLAGVLVAILAIRLPSWLGLVGLAGLAAVFAKAVSIPHLAVALLACLVIAARPRLLALAPLVVIGTYSYGLYLWHPLAALITDQLAGRIALTALATVACFHLLEFPIRRTMAVRPAIAVMALASLAAVAIVAIPERSIPLSFIPTAPVAAAAPPALSTGRPPTQTATFEGASSGQTSKPGSAPTAVAPPRPTADLRRRRLDADVRRCRVAGMGSGVSRRGHVGDAPRSNRPVDIGRRFLDPRRGSDRWARPAARRSAGRYRSSRLPTDLRHQAAPDRRLGLLRLIEAPLGHPDEHVRLAPGIPRALAQMHLDVLVVSWGVTAMWEYQLPDGHTLRIGDPEFDTLLAERMSEFEAMAARYGTRVLWLTYLMLPTDAGAAEASRRSTDALSAVVMQRPCAVDLGKIVGDDPTFDWYQDGYHFTPQGAARAIAAIVPALPACLATPIEPRAETTTR